MLSYSISRDQIRQLARAEAERRGLIAPPRVVASPPEWAHPDQLRWYHSRATTSVGLAGAQGGKTAMLPYIHLRNLIEAAPLARELGRADSLYIGPTLALLSAQAIPALERLWVTELGLGRMLRGGSPRLELSESGSRRLFGEPIPGVIRVAYASDSSNLESITALCASWDEAGQPQNREESYHAVLRRLSIARSHGHGRLAIGTTPYEWGWLKRLVVDRADGDQIEVFNWPSWCNPRFDKSIAESARHSYPEWRWEMMYLGRYTRPAGMVYDCWDPATMVVDRFEIPPDWPLYLGVDFGLINTAAVLLAEECRDDWRTGDSVPTGRYYVVGAYHAGASRPASEHLMSIRSMADSVVAGRKSKRPIAVGGNHAESGWRESWSLAGLPVIEPPLSAPSAQVFATYDGFATGRLRVFRDLSDLIHDIETLSYLPDNDGLPTDRYEDTTYHRMSALRYLGSYLFRGGDRNANAFYAA